ncbi:MAG: phospholipase [Acidobacteria bacterium]|nr:MAG: phospholipase [Acidobacteriota bacterium]
MSHQLITLPDDTAEPIIEAIHSAKQSLRVKMFLFTDPTLLETVIAARKRGVRVQVMLNPARRSGQVENTATRKRLLAAKVEVKDSNPAFEVTHEKSMIVDDEAAYIKSLNWDTKNLTETRDYAVITTRKPEVEEALECFEADWKREKFKVDESRHLIWCSGNGRDRIARFIDEAKHSLYVQNERYQDAVIIERLVRANRRGVKVHVLARPPHKLKKEKLLEGVGGLRIMDDVGIKVHRLKHLKLHGKMLLADHSRAIIGSINLTPGSFDSRRELAIEVHNADLVERLGKIVRHDWKHSRTMDLSDAGLLVELEDAGMDAARELALGEKLVGKKRKGGRH